MNIFEIIALISTILCVVLSSKEHIIAWAMGIVSVLSLIVVYIGAEMYGQIVLQSVFLIQCVIGWLNWGKKEPLSINIKDRDNLLAHISITIMLGFIYGMCMMLLKPDGNPVFTYIDAISAFIALLGNYYLTKKTIQAWPLFMTYNILVSILFAYQGIYMLMGLNLCLFCISGGTYFAWRKKINN